MLLTFKTIRRILSQRFIFFSWSASLRGSHAKLKPGGLWPCLPQRCRCSRLNPFKKTKPVPTQLNLDWAWLDQFSINRSMSSAEKNLFFNPQNLAHLKSDIWPRRSWDPLSCSCAMCWLVAANLESSQLEKLFSTAVVDQCISIANNSGKCLLLPCSGWLCISNLLRWVAWWEKLEEECGEKCLEEHKRGEREPIQRWEELLEE